MKNIFEQGHFNDYMNNINLDEAAKPIMESYDDYRTTVFISHKHSELDELMGLIGFLENEYDVKAYIDSRDPFMPNNTSGETALRIKKENYTMQ